MVTETGPAMTMEDTVGSSSGSRILVKINLELQHDN